mmetsp:Transcript_60513/g.100448  ORF Transcript_60513/g.100448 Transcript_60513/m.100448 type:complete len:1169 (+) Transcript_60513:45-3551(+)
MTGSSAVCTCTGITCEVSNFFEGRFLHRAADCGRPLRLCQCGLEVNDERLQLLAMGDTFRFKCTACGMPIAFVGTNADLELEELLPLRSGLSWHHNEVNKYGYSAVWQCGPCMETAQGKPGAGPRRGSIRKLDPSSTDPRLNPKLSLHSARTGKGEVHRKWCAREGGGSCVTSGVACMHKRRRNKQPGQFADVHRQVLTLQCVDGTGAAASSSADLGQQQAVLDVHRQVATPQCVGVTAAAASSFADLGQQEAALDMPRDVTTLQCVDGTAVAASSCAELGQHEAFLDPELSVFDMLQSLGDSDVSEGMLSPVGHLCRWTRAVETSATGPGEAPSGGSPWSAPSGETPLSAQATAVSQGEAHRGREHIVRAVWMINLLREHIDSMEDPAAIQRLQTYVQAFEAMAGDALLLTEAYRCVGAKPLLGLLDTPDLSSSQAGRDNLRFLETRPSHAAQQPSGASTPMLYVVICNSAPNAPPSPQDTSEGKAVHAQTAGAAVWLQQPANMVGLCCAVDSGAWLHATGSHHWLSDDAAVHELSRLELALLNGSCSEELGETLARAGVRHVVCWATERSELSARLFAEGFWAALHSGASFETAYDAGVQQVEGATTWNGKAWRQMMAIGDPGATSVCRDAQERWAAGVPVLLLGKGPQVEPARLRHKVASMSVADVAPLPAPSSSLPSRKKALVVGISKYHRKPLRCTINDAVDLHAALQRMGFTSTLLTDCNTEELNQAIHRFCSSLSRGDIAFFFFTGHGIEAPVHGTGKMGVDETSNWLITTDMPDAASELPRCGINVLTLLSYMEKAGANLNVLVLDCCHSNPLVAEDRSCSDEEGSGLVRMVAPAGSLIAFACEPRCVASELPNRRNGLYTKHLLQHIETADQPVVDLFSRVCAGVAAESRHFPRGQQKPYYNSGLAVIGATLTDPSPQPRSVQSQTAINRHVFPRECRNAYSSGDIGKQLDLCAIFVALCKCASSPKQLDFRSTLTAMCKCASAPPGLFRVSVISEGLTRSLEALEEAEAADAFVGDFLQFSMRACFPGFIYLLMVNSLGEVKCVFPNVKDKDNLVLYADQAVMVPNKRHIKNYLKVAMPVGHEDFYYINSSERLEDCMQSQALPQKLESLPQKEASMLVNAIASMQKGKKSAVTHCMKALDAPRLAISLFRLVTTARR